jgi:hypothetical protein
MAPLNECANPSVNVYCYITGPTIGVQAIGLIVSALLITKLQPSARKLAGFNVFTGSLFFFVLLAFTQMRCHQGTKLDFEGGSLSYKLNLTNDCNAACNCQKSNFDPACYVEEDKIFYSPCHAGCLNYDKETGIIGNCSCLPDAGILLQRGTCTDKPNCRTIFMLFIIIRVIISFLDSFGRIGNILITFRCVEPQLKALAIGIQVFSISLFATLPSPLFFGKIIGLSQ